MMNCAYRSHFAEGMTSELHENESAARHGHRYGLFENAVARIGVMSCRLLGAARVVNEHVRSKQAKKHETGMGDSHPLSAPLGNCLGLYVAVFRHSNSSAKLID